jgi:hypothetical protein
LTQFRAVPEIPNQDERCSRRIESSMVSTAAERSRREARNLLLATGSDEIVKNSKKSSFCRMEFDIGRLK